MHQYPNPKPDRPRMAQATHALATLGDIALGALFCIYQRE